MITTDNQISLNYFVVGECLKNSGVYTVADVTVKNAFTKNEVFILNKPSRTIVPAEYNYSQTSITLGGQFIEACLEAPVKPQEVNYHKWLRTPLGKLSQDWKKLTPEQKIHRHIEIYVADMGGIEFEYEIV